MKGKKDQPDMKKSIGFPLFCWIVGILITFIGGAYYFGHENGQNKVGLSLIHYEQENLKLKSENDSLLVVLAHCPPIDSCYASIIKPLEQSLINQPDCVPIEGTIKNLPAKHHLWLIVHPQAHTGWWPQISEVIPSPNGSWSGIVRLGGHNNKGERFDIHVVVADERANVLFNSNEYLNSASGKPLPAGAKSLLFITLTKN